MINLVELFRAQKILDDRIVDEHNLQGQDLLPKKILSLLVELGELCQEWRGFKFWSSDQEPRTKEVLGWVNPQKYKNPLLEEFSDCLHFILSIGNDLEINNIELYTILPFKHKTTLDQFSQTYYVIGDLEHDPSQEGLIKVLQYLLSCRV